MYGLPDADMDQLQIKVCEPGTSMANILCPRKEIPWATSKRGISVNDFSAEVRLWLAIIGSKFCLTRTL